MNVSGMGSGMASVSPEMMQRMREAREQGKTPGDFAEALVADKDTDGDSLLSLSETELDEDKFNSIDADGDGLLSAEEIVSDMQQKMEQMRQMRGQMNMMGRGQGGDSGDASKLLGDSGESDSEGDSSSYDDLDLNQDGVVSMQEYLQAYQGGRSGLSDIFGSSEGETGAASFFMQQKAVKAYQAQGA